MPLNTKIIKKIEHANEWGITSLDLSNIVPHNTHLIYENFFKFPYSFYNPCGNSDMSLYGADEIRAIFKGIKDTNITSLNLAACISKDSKAIQILAEELKSTQLTSLNLDFNNIVQEYVNSCIDRPYYKVAPYWMLINKHCNSI